MIAGGGFFEHYTELPIGLAWQAARAEHRPGRDYLEWHNENRFRG